jgi:hypothetical protein
MAVFHVAKAGQAKETRHIDSGRVCAQLNQSPVQSLGCARVHFLALGEQPVEVAIVGSAGLDRDRRLKAFPDRVENGRATPSKSA